MQELADIGLSTMKTQRVRVDDRQPSALGAAFAARALHEVPEKAEAEPQLNGPRIVAAGSKRTVKAKSKRASVMPSNVEELDGVRAGSSIAEQHASQTSAVPAQPGEALSVLDVDLTKKTLLDRAEREIVTKARLDEISAERDRARAEAVE